MGQSCWSRTMSCSTHTHTHSQAVWHGAEHVDCLLSAMQTGQCMPDANVLPADLTRQSKQPARCLDCWRNTYLNGAGVVFASVLQLPAVLAHKQARPAQASPMTNCGNMRCRHVCDPCCWCIKGTKAFSFFLIPLSIERRLTKQNAHSRSDVSTHSTHFPHSRPLLLPPPQQLQNGQSHVTDHVLLWSSAKITRLVLFWPEST